MVTVGLTVLPVIVVKAASVYHCNVLPLAHVAFNVAEEPKQILGALRPVGARGNGVTITLVSTAALLQAVFAELVQLA